MAFTTFDPNNKNVNVTLSAGNLAASGSAGSGGPVHTTAFYKSTGKWYFEVTITTAPGSNFNVGVDTSAANTTTETGENATGYAYTSTGLLRHNASTIQSGMGTYTTGDVISVLYDADAETLTFWKNGSVAGSTQTGITEDSYQPSISLSTNGLMTANFGATAYAYTPPGGYSSWVAPGLPEGAAEFNALTAAAYAPYGNTSFAAMAALAGGPVIGEASFLPLDATTVYGIGSEPAMTAVGYVTSAAPSMAAMTATGAGDQLDYAIAAFAAMTATGEGQGGTAISVAGRAAIPILDSFVLAGEAITAALRAPAPTLFAIYQNPATITIIGSAPVPRATITVLTGNVLTAELAALAPVLAAAGFSSGTITAVLVAPAPVLSATMSAAILAAFRTWVLNTRKGALTEYGPEFTFNSFAQFNGQVLACGSGGIVVLGAQGLDNTAAITARFRTGQESFQSSLHKRVPRIYMSGTYAGDMLFRTIVENGTRTYSLPLNGITRLQQRRIPVGKGPKSRFWQFEGENVLGADFGVNDILVLPTGLRRRVQ